MDEKDEAQGVKLVTTAPVQNTNLAPRTRLLTKFSK